MTPSRGSTVGVRLFETASLQLCEFAQTEWVLLPKPLVVESGAGETGYPERLEASPPEAVVSGFASRGPTP